MARHIEARPDKSGTLSRGYTPDQVINAFNTALTVLRGRTNPVMGEATRMAQQGVAVTEKSLQTMGLDPQGIKPGDITEGLISHTFSRTGEDITFNGGVFVGQLIDGLSAQARLHHSLARDIHQASLKGFPTDRETIMNELASHRRYNTLADILRNSSVPYKDRYPFDSDNLDMEAIKEFFAYQFVHEIPTLDSNLEESSLAHRDQDWNRAADDLLNHESILIVPPSELVTTDGRGSRRWYTGWGLFSQTDGSKDEKEKKGVGCFPWFVLGVGALVLARQCDPLAAPQENQPQPSPSPLAAEKPAGAPVVGVINGVPTVEIRPAPEDDVFTPETAVLSPPQAECEPGMDIITIEIKREGDSDANRIYRYPNRVNLAGDSAKGLFDKELVNSYVKDNPYSDTAIRYSLSNQRNEGRDVQESDPDLLALLDEARLFYGQPVTDSAYLTWVDSIKRNNPPGTIVGDLINAKEFRSQDPRSLIRRLQAIPRP